MVEGVCNLCCVHSWLFNGNYRLEASLNYLSIQYLPIAKQQWDLWTRQCNLRLNMQINDPPCMKRFLHFFHNCSLIFNLLTK